MCKCNLLSENFKYKPRLNCTDSYIYGLLLADGYLHLDSRNRGCVTLEVAEKDKDICKKLCKIIPGSAYRTRTRSTNFKQNYKVAGFFNYKRIFRENLILCGFPQKNKTRFCSVPCVPYHKFDFWRGVIDGDGSLGRTAKNELFIALGTKSKRLKKDYCRFLLEEYKIKKKIHRNIRDKFYNVTVKQHSAQLLVKDLYYDASCFLDRKYKIAEAFWEQDLLPHNIKNEEWSKEEDDYIMSHTIQDSYEYLNRSEEAIKIRKWRLQNKQKRVI